jgi:transcriptional regulator with XRE-family HTH domain
MNKKYDGQFQKTFGLVVSRYRKSASLTQEELADRCQLHRTYIADIEGGRRNLSLSSIIALSMGLQIKPSEIFLEVEKGGTEDE